MNFDFSDDQRLLADTVAQLVSREGGLARWRARPRGGVDRRLWTVFAELGLLGLPFAEADGGFGGSAVDLMIVMEGFGRGLLLEPYLSTVVLGGGLVALAGSAAQKAAVLPPLVEGRMLLALAHGEPASRYALAHVETAARRDGAGHRLSGRKSVVLGGDAADHFIVSARGAGAPGDADGVSLFLIDRATPGLRINPYPTIDGLGAAELALDQVRVGPEALLGPAGAALPLVEHALDRAVAALAAEAVGIMEALNRLTLDYLKTRQQFGVPIGSFQALQHRMAEMAIEQELAKSMAVLAALALAEDDAAARRRTVSAAKVRIGRAGRFVGEQAIQLHGGIGLTEECAASHYFKRLIMIDRSLGDCDHHLERFALA